METLGEVRFRNTHYYTYRPMLLLKTHYVFAAN